MSRKITIIIKTFERPYCLDNLLASYRRLFQKMQWECRILIADDSQKPNRERMLARYGDIITRYMCLPFHTGVSYGRNTLVSRVKTPYFLHCDDDFILTRRSDLLKMMTLLESTDLDLLGGTWYNRAKKIHGESRSQMLLRLLKNKQLGDFLYELLGKGRAFPYYGNFQRKGEILSTVPITYTSPYSRCDLVINFFMAKTSSFRKLNMKWDEDLKTHEHEAFFYEAKLKGLKVGVTEEASIIHQPMSSRDYDQFRFPEDDIYGKKFLEKHRLKKFDDGIGYSSFQL